MITGSNIVDVSTKKLYFKTITEIEIENLFKYLEIKKGSDIDVIPPKLIKLSANIRSRLVKEAIDTTLTQNVFSRKHSNCPNDSTRLA